MERDTGTQTLLTVLIILAAIVLALLLLGVVLMAAMMAGMTGGGMMGPGLSTAILGVGVLAILVLITGWRRFCEHRGVVRRVYLVGGPARVGKSSLARRLLLSDGIPWFPTDVLRTVLRRVLPSSTNSIKAT